MNPLHFLKTLAGMAALFVSAALPGTAQGAIIYDWSGTCSFGCTGSATGVLTLTDSYVPGTVVQLVDFESWRYESSSATFEVPAFRLWDVGGRLPAGAGPAFVFMEYLTATHEIGRIETDFNGFDPWERFHANGGTPPVEGGGTHSWQLRVAAVPEPSTLWLLGVGLARLLFVGWRLNHRRRMA